MTTPNTAIADRARQLADQAPGGSLARRTAGCVVVAYSTTRTPEHARKVLDGVPEELRAECAALADKLTAQIGGEA
ncbi:hypothetical protein GCM10017559_08120 [Streptosporangium longisporum]|uniref:Uncharacterized protein n=1 Tax=Streptosporangium longisporum TaxID=46187 RepID=A0ABN3XTM1_9ACTN